MFGDVVLGREIDHGSYGCVRSAVSLVSRQTNVAKEFQCEDPTVSMDVVRELAALSAMQCVRKELHKAGSSIDPPFPVLQQVIVDSMADGKAGLCGGIIRVIMSSGVSDSQSIRTLLGSGDGDTSCYADAVQSLQSDEEEVMAATRCLLEASNILSAGCGLLHRDWKPENILWSPSTHAFTVIDFGTTASQHVHLASYNRFGAAAVVGSLAYASPELLFGAGSNCVSESWAIGCQLYFIATGDDLFDDSTEFSLITSWIAEIGTSVVAEAVFRHLPRFSTLSTDDEVLQAVALRRDDDDGPKLTQLEAQFPALHDVVTRLLTPDWRERPEAADVLALLSFGAATPLPPQTLPHIPFEVSLVPATSSSVDVTTVTWHFFRTISEGFHPVVVFLALDMMHLSAQRTPALIESSSVEEVLVSLSTFACLSSKLLDDAFSHEDFLQLLNRSLLRHFPHTIASIAAESTAIKLKEMMLFNSKSFVSDVLPLHRSPPGLLKDHRLSQNLAATSSHPSSEARSFVNFVCRCRLPNAGGKNKVLASRDCSDGALVPALIAAWGTSNPTSTFFSVDDDGSTEADAGLVSTFLSKL